MDQNKEQLSFVNFRKLCHSIQTGIIQNLKIQNGIPMAVDINTEILTKNIKNSFDYDKNERYFKAFEALCKRIQFGQIDNLEVQDGLPQVDKLTKKDISLKIVFDKPVEFVEQFK